MDIVSVLFGCFVFTVATWLVFLLSGLLIFRRGKAGTRTADSPLWERVDTLDRFDG